METWSFGINNDALIELVLSGTKTATTSLNNTKLPKVGEKSILVFDNEKKACVVETKEVKVLKFKDITKQMAYLEGEGDRTLKYYKQVHTDYFKSIDSKFNEDTEVVFEIFEVIEDLRKTRIEKAKKLVEFNKDIFGEGQHTITEINAGFNNDIFNVDNTYIIKVCGNGKESEFEVEAKFYTENKNSKNIPKLYKYDNSKKIIKQVYEIIEKVEGKTVYYHWYKWNEKQRTSFIKELMNIIKELHSNKRNSYDWANKIKSKVQSYYNKCMDLFDNNEQEIINKTLELYDEILSDNRFSLIHNDLHFDNILISESNEIKIIDFNDSQIAPIDYDLRILFMCKDRPWKWANAEMDPFQKPQDYANIQTYIKKYYEELGKIRHLDKRITIYEIMNDIKLLSRFKNETELKENIIVKSKSLFLNC